MSIRRPSHLILYPKQLYRGLITRRHLSNISSQVHQRILELTSNSYSTACIFNRMRLQTPSRSNKRHQRNLRNTQSPMGQWWLFDSYDNISLTRGHTHRTSIDQHPEDFSARYQVCLCAENTISVDWLIMYNPGRPPPPDWRLSRKRWE